MSKLAEKMRGGIPTSALGTQPAATGPAPAPTALSQRLEAMQRGEEATLPLIGRVWIQIVGHPASNAIEAATFKAMADAGLPPIAGHAWSYDIHRKARTLAAAVRDPDDHTKPFGTVGEWLGEEGPGETRLDDDVIFACGKIYEDVKERLDPVGSASLTEEITAALTDAFKKKDATLMRSHGVVSVVNWLLSGAVQLPSSPTVASPSGELSADD